ncbi:hypothetical protein [Streptomyces fuscichromogenes]|uniref:Uncharacterized protein n=1 Tax=Streptomyces fuscichromogenes TaxID=1324013 RepID=A0A917XR98_9ACTN|nr:hypothetical protein [Streptomyces fuscichromogenes]GGN46740.1 hypothetical protein GCM10011578_099840 [Streptomyces fuscichromogenes]
MTTELSSYGPLQFPDRAGLSLPQFERAQRLQLIPGPDAPGGRWSAAVFEDAATRIDAIKDAVGSLPDLGAERAEMHLAERFLAATVHPGTAAELARRGHLPVVGDYKGHPLYCGLTLERGLDRQEVARASAAGQLHTRDAAADVLGIRAADFEHLVRAGLLVHADTARSYWKDLVLLYRQGDLDRLSRSRRIDWAAVRATPRGRRSPLAALPDAKKAPV